MAKLLPSAGIVEKVFNYLIDRVTGARTQPLPRHPARRSVAKTHMRKRTSNGEGTTLDDVLSPGRVTFEFSIALSRILRFYTARYILKFVLCTRLCTAMSKTE